MKRVVAAVALPLAYVVFAAIAWLLRLVRWRRPLIDRHVARCLTELSPARRREIAGRFYRYLGELAAEVACEPLLDRAALESRLRIENEPDVAAHLAAQRCVLILSAHHGNWEWLLLRCSTAFEARLTAVYKRLPNPRLDRFVLRLRERFGGRMVRSKQLVTHLIEQRGQVRLLAMLADQSPAAGGKQQAWLDLFGHPTAFHSGPGWIVAKFGFRPYFAAMRRERRGHYVVRLVELLPGVARPTPEQVLQAYVRALETHVREHPEQYFWAYNRWKREKPLYG
jgi:KDO2-lipid IV(A) lauroyltransferase